MVVCFSAVACAARGLVVAWSATSVSNTAVGHALQCRPGSHVVTLPMLFAMFAHGVWVNTVEHELLQHAACSCCGRTYDMTSGVSGAFNKCAYHMV
jgi:hypothetical protein